MATQKPTPEEKLFAVIQGAQHPPLRARAQALSLASVGVRLSTLIGPLDLPRVNQALAMVIGILGLICVVNPMLMQPRLDRLMEEAHLRAKPFAITPPLQGLKSSQDYADMVRDKNPFRVEEPAVASHETPPEPTPVTPPQPDFQAALSNVKLVGISWSPDPTAMIEESETKQTHFLKRGSTLGPFTIKEILPNRVILRVGDKDFELF